MDISESISFDVSNHSRSFFSSFSSQLSANSSWKPILNSFQENQRLSRLIQVRETKLKELKDGLENVSRDTSKSKPLITGDEITGIEDLDKLDTILDLSRNNLRIMSVKMGSMPRKLAKALEVVNVDFANLTSQGKLECLSAMEILREKLIDLSLDSNEILNYFKDILLEVETHAVAQCANKETAMKLVDQGVEIQQSNDTTRTKIQEMYHLIMKMEGLSFVGDEPIVTSKTQMSYETHIKQLADELSKKNLELKNLRKFYADRLEDVYRKNKLLQNDMKKLRHCVEFEMFSTWSCFIGQENIDEPSCYQVIRQIVKYQNEKKGQIKEAGQKTLDLKISFEGFKKDYNSFVGDTVKGFKDTQGQVVKKLFDKQIEVRDMRKGLEGFKEEIKIELKSMQEYMSNLITNTKTHVAKKLDTFNRAQNLKSQIEDLKKTLSEDTQKALISINTHKDSLSNFKNKIFQPLSKIQSTISFLSNEQKILKKIVTQDYPQLFAYLQSLINKQSLQNMLNFYLTPLRKKTLLLESEITDMKIFTINNLQSFCQDLLLKYRNTLLDYAKALNDKNALKKWLNNGNLFIKSKLKELKDELNQVSKDKIVFCQKIVEVQAQCCKIKKEYNEFTVLGKKDIENLRCRYEKLLKALMDFIGKARKTNTIKKLEWEQERQAFAYMIKQVQENLKGFVIINEGLKNDMTKSLQDKDLTIKNLTESLDIKDQELKETYTKVIKQKALEEEMSQSLAEQEGKIRDLEEELTSTREDLDETQENLNQAKEGLKQAESELQTTKDALIKFQDKSMNSESKLIRFKENLEKTQKDIEKQSSKNKQLEQELLEKEKFLADFINKEKVLNENLSIIQSALESTQGELVSVQAKLYVVEEDMEKKTVELAQTQQLAGKKASELENALVAIKQNQEIMAKTEAEMSFTKALLNEKHKKLKKIPQIKQSLHKCALELPLLYKDVASLKEELIEQLNIIKQSTQNSSEKHDNLEIHVLQLEEVKRELEKANSELFEKYENVCRVNSEYLRRENTYKKQLSVKVQRVLRKVKAYKSVLIKEKEYYTFMFRSLKDWLSNSMIMELENKYSQMEAKIKASCYENIENIRANCEIKEQKALELASKTKGIQSRAQSCMKKLQETAKFEIFSFKEQVEEFMKESFSKMLVEFQDQIYEKIKSLLDYKEKTKTKLLAHRIIIKDLKEQNKALRDLVSESVKSCTIELEYLKTSMEGHLRKDSFQMTSTFENLIQAYNTENSDLLQENAKIHKMIEVRNEFIVPASRFITENAESISEINEVFSKNSAITQKNIEENIRKLSEVCFKIEGLNDKGYEILSKYRKDCFLFETAESVGDAIERRQSYSFDFSEASLESLGISSSLEEENKLCLKNNPLLKKYNPKNKQTLRVPSLIKTIEKILGDKYKSDMESLSKGRNPQAMSDYMITWLMNDSRVTVEKKVSEILNTFRENLNDTRIRLYSRLFQVFDPNPVSYKLSLYLIKMRYYFNVFISKQVIPESSQKKVDKMQVTEILKTVRKLFNSDTPTGEVVLKHMRPEGMLSIVWSLTCIQYYLFKKSISTEQFYETLTKDVSISENDFVEGLSKKHNTFVSMADLSELFNANSTEEMTAEEFINLFDLKSYFDRHQKYMVDQLQFLNALIEGYTAMRIRRLKELELLIQEKCGKKEKLNKDEVMILLRELEPTLNVEKILENFEEITTKDFRSKAFEMNLGGKGIGCFNLKSIEKICDEKTEEEESQSEQF